MLCKVLLSWALILTALEPLLTLPITHFTGMSYSEPDEEQVVNPDEMSYSEQAILSQGFERLGFPSFLTGDDGPEALRSASVDPNQEALREKPWLNPLSRFLGRMKHYRKRGGNSECFWKYCV